MVAAIWGKLLGIDPVPDDVDFFALGGDSMQALALLSAVELRFGRRLTLDFFAEGPATLARMELLLDGDEPRPIGTAPRVEAQPMPNSDDEAISLAEQGILARSILAADPALYNVPFALRLQGPLDLSRFEGAVQRVVDAYEGLRTSFPTVNGRTVRSVATSVPTPSPCVHSAQTTTARLPYRRSPAALRLGARAPRPNSRSSC